MRIKATLVIMLLLFTIITTGFIINYFFVRQNISSTVDQDMFLAIDFADSLVSTKMQLIKANGAMVAERLLRSGSTGEMTEIMALEIAKFPEFRTLSVFDLDHGVVANYGVPVKSAELLEESRYVQMAYNGESVIPTTHYDPETNDFIMHVFVPMTTNMVMVATIPGFTFSDLIRGYRVWQTGFILILDEEGTIIAEQNDESVLRRLNPIQEAQAHPEDKEILSMKDTVEQILSTRTGTGSFLYNGMEYICRYKIVSGTTGGWHILVIAPMKENPGSQVHRDLFHSALFFLVIGFLISILVSPFVVRPFEKIEEQAAKILESHKRTNLLLNAMPLSCHLWNSNYEMFYCNDENQRLFNLKSAQEFINNYDDFIPEYQNDGQLSSEKKNYCLKKAFEEGRYKFEWMYQLKDGTKIPTEIILVSVPFDDVNVVAAYTRDLREQKKMTSEILQRDMLLDTVNSAAAILLKSEIDDFERSLKLCMSMIAEAVNLDRVHIWKRYKKDGVLYMDQIYDWCGDTKPRKIISYTTEMANKNLPGWIAALSSGKCINNIIRDMSCEEQAVFSPQGIQSIFVMPVFLSDEFWGLIGYDDCHRERIFTENEQSILSSAGNLIAYAIFQNEMTRSIRASAAKLEAVLNNYSGIIWSVDKNLIITLYQGRYVDRTGNIETPVEGSTLHQFLDKAVKKPQHKKIFDNVLKTFTEGPKEWDVWVNNNRLHFSSTPIYDEFGIVTDIVGSLVDITELSRLQTELEAALVEAREANNAKSDFLARMSHEMRTPLNAIIGLSGLSLETKGASKEIYDNLEKVYEAGEILLSTVNDILDISKIEAGRLELIPDEYNIPSLINDTITQNILRIGEKPIKFVLDMEPSMPAYLCGDELRIKQIFNNLLSNAFKYTKKGKVELCIKCEREKNTVWMTIRVQDTGRGIRPQEIGNLFTDYAQLDKSANRNIEGTGLGLSITKKIAEMMGGSVTVESEYGKGSVFTARFKQKYVNDSVIGEDVVNNLKNFRYSDHRRRKKSLLVRNRMPYAHVLVVDDTATNLDVARGMLRPYGMKIDCVNGGQEAVDAIRDEKMKYDAVFMDHMMPEMDGIKAVRIIRNEIGTEYARTVPIIALTANAIVGNDKMFLEKGFQAFISKPIDVTQLDSVLNTWIRDRQSEETLLRAEKESMDDENAKMVPAGGMSAFQDFELEGVAFDEGIERYSTEEAYLNIIRSYCLQTPAILDKIRNAGSPPDGGGISLPEYTIIVHGLKGSSYSISANAVGREAEKLEAAARAGDFEEVKTRNASFISMTEALLSDLGGLLEKIPDRGLKTPGNAPDPVLLTRLLEAAKEYKAATMEQTVKQLESFEYESGGDLVTWIREQMDNLECDAIRERLETSVVN